MTRNKALQGAAWLITLIIANATTIGYIIQESAAGLETGLRMGAEKLEVNDLTVNAYRIAHPDIATHSWWAAFVVLTFFSIYMGKVFIALWGEKEQTPVRIDNQSIIDGYYKR